MTITETKRYPAPANGQTPEVETQTQKTPLEQVFGQFQNSDKFLGYADSTRTNCLFVLHSLQRFCRDGNILEVEQLSEDVLKDWISKPMQEGIPRRTIKINRSFIGTFRQWYEDETCTSNFSILNGVQRKDLIRTIRNLRDASLILIALETGATIWENLNLNAEDIYREGAESFILFNGSTKAEPITKFRVVKIEERIADIVTAYIKNTGFNQGTPAFRNSHGARLTKKEAEGMLREYGIEIGAENLSFRTLRNTFIENFKGSEFQLKEILGISRTPTAPHSPKHLIEI